MRKQKGGNYAGLSIAERLKRKVEKVNANTTIKTAVEKVNVIKDEGSLGVDNCMNLSVPCCNQVQQVLFDIFPDLSNLSREDDGSKGSSIGSNSNSNSNLQHGHGNSSVLGRIVRKHFEQILKCNGKGPTKSVINQPDQHQQTTSKRKNRKKKNGSSDATGEKPKALEPSRLVINILQSLSENEITSSQTKPLPPQRDLTSFLEYLDSSLSASNHQSSPCASNKKKNDASTNSKSKSTKSSATSIASSFPVIYIHSLRRYCDSIQCGECRRDVIKYLDYLESSHVQNNTGQRSFADSTTRLQPSKHQRYSAQNLVEINASSVRLPTNNDSYDIDSFPSHYHCTTSDTSIPVVSEVSMIPTSEEGIFHNGYKDSNLEDAFDYIAMEEGCPSMTRSTATTVETDSISDTKPTQDEFCIYLRSCKDRDGSILLQPVQTLNSHPNPTQPDFNPFTVSNVEHLLQDILLPCASDFLPISSLSSSSNLNTFRRKDEQLVGSYSSQLQKDIASHLVEFKNILTEIQQVYVEANDISIDGTTPFAPKRSLKLRECDKKCYSFMELVQKFLLMLHRQTLAARSSLMEFSYDSDITAFTTTDNTEQVQLKWLNDMMDNMWQTYERAVSSLIENTIQHRWQVIQLEDTKTHAIPALYNNERRRSCFSKMLEDKLAILIGVYDKIASVLSDDQHYGRGCNSTVRLLASISSKYSVLHNKHATHALKSKHCSEELKSCPLSLSLLSESRLKHYEDILDKRLELASQTIHESKTTDILAIHSKCYKSTRVYARTLAEDLVDNDTLRIPPKVRVEWTANKILLEEKVYEEESDCNNGLRHRSGSEGDFRMDMEKDLNDIKYVYHLVADVLKQYLLRDKIEASMMISMPTKQSSTTKEKNSRSLNHFVHPWLDEVTTEDMDRHMKQEDVVDWSDDRSVCDGKGGKRRVICMISACLYFWLREQCNIWHADLTQQELLAAMEDEVNLTKGVEKVQKTKKSKKKQKRRTNNSVVDRKATGDNVARTSEPLDEVTTVLHVKGGIEIPKTICDEKALASTSQAQIVDEATVQSDEDDVDKGQDMVEDTVNDDQRTLKQAESRGVEESSTPSAQEVPTIDDDLDNAEETCTCVGAIDSYNHVVPAEEYLLKRYFRTISITDGSVIDLKL